MGAATAAYAWSCARRTRSATTRRRLRA